MDIKLHSNATTTPKIRTYLQQSNKSDSELAQQLGISVQTVRRWRDRDDVNDRSHRPNKINRTFSFEQEFLLCFLRRYLNLSLDELVEAGQALIHNKASRAVINRCLKKYGLNKNPKTEGTIEQGHTFLLMFPLPKEISKNEDYLFILIEKTTGYISCACLDKELKRQQNIIDYFKNNLPYKIKQIELSSELVNHTIVQSCGAQLKVIEFDLTPLEVVNFKQDFVQLVIGNYTDKRLGIDAQLFRYEEYLNKYLKRNRLKKLSPYDYLIQTHS